MVTASHSSCGFSRWVGSKGRWNHGNLHLTVLRGKKKDYDTHCRFVKPGVSGVSWVYQTLPFPSLPSFPGGGRCHPTLSTAPLSSPLPSPWSTGSLSKHNFFAPSGWQILASCIQQFSSSLGRLGKGEQLPPWRRKELWHPSSPAKEERHYCSAEKWKVAEGGMESQNTCRKDWRVTSWNTVIVRMALQINFRMKIFQIQGLSFLQ